MADISELEGINSDEVNRLCGAHIGTREEFLAQVGGGFNYGIMYMSIKTGIKPDRLIQFVPPESLPVHLLPNLWLEDLAKRVLREAPTEDPWLKRCRYGLNRFTGNLRGNWLGWQKNVPILALIAGVMMLLTLALRASGGLQLLPSPLGLRERVLVVAHDLNSGKALVPDDFYLALLPVHSDYFRSTDDLQGLVLARPMAGQTPLRFRDVLRQQVIAIKDIPADATFQKDDVTLRWTSYQPRAALALQEVYGRKASRGIRKDGVVLIEFIKPPQ